MRTFLVATSKRDKQQYPHPSQFTFELPVTLRNVVGMAIRDFKFGNELLINENNKILKVTSGGVTQNVMLSTGDYNNNITSLLTELNSKLSSYQVTFSLNTTTNRVQIAYAGGSSVVVGASTVLRILGFPEGKFQGLCLYNGTQPTTVTDSVIFASGSIAAPDKYDVYNLAEMVVRITDVETILSNDAVTNRSAAVLFNSNSASHVVKQCLDHYIPLLQQQSRLQSLKIQLLNMEGDLYDTINNEAVILFEFYCVPEDGRC